MKIVGKVGEVLKLDQAYVVNGLARFVRMKVNSNMSHALVHVVQIPLIGHVFGSRVACNDLGYEHLPHLFFHFGLLNNGTSACMNIRICSRHINFRDRLQSDLNVSIIHVKCDVYVTSSCIGLKVSNDIFGVVQKDVDASHLEHEIGQRTSVEDLVRANDISNSLNMVNGDLLQTRKDNRHG